MWLGRLVFFAEEIHLMCTKDLWYVGISKKLNFSV